MISAEFSVFMTLFSTFSSLKTNSKSDSLGSDFIKDEFSSNSFFILSGKGMFDSLCGKLWNKMNGDEYIQGCLVETNALVFFFF